MADVTPVDSMTSEIVPESPPQSMAMWVRENLFSSRSSGVLSIVSIGLVTFVARNIIAWLFAPNRGWEAVATNLRLYMVQAYPAGPETPGCVPGATGCIPNQFVRVWLAVGIVLVLAALSMAAWRVGSRVSANKLASVIRSAGAVVAVLAFLGPPTQHVDFLSGIDIPLVGTVLGWVGATLGFLIEAALMTGGRLAVFLVGGVLAVGAHLAMRVTKDADLGLHSLWIPAGAAALVVAALWVVPFGHYFFDEQGVGFESGTIAASTKGPWTVLFVATVAAYFVGRFVIRLLSDKALRSILILFWSLSLPVIVLFILRDPDFNPARDGGGIDFFTGTDVTVWLVFAALGGLVIFALSFPQLGEVGRALSGVLLIGSLALWAFPMLMRVRIIGLLFALFAVGAQTFGGDKRARIRYVGLWVGLTTVLVWLFAAINTESSLTISGKSFLGGLMLTFVLALTSILMSFPIGLLMALGRTSTMPIFRVFSTVYIEMVRGIPFITVLIFFDLILVLFLPGNVEFDSVTLAIIGGTLFSSAYLAENVRGGLQSIPKGQYEAARAMGLSTLQLTVFIVLPQALRAVIPALVGQTISIFKDTSLVAIIGLFDFLFIADKVVPSQTIFLGIKLENIVFISLVYWMFTFSFSRASLRLEKKLGLGER